MKAPLHVKIIIGLVLGVIWALVAAHFGYSEFNIKWVKPFGDIFIRLLKMIAVPLVLFSIMGGVASLSDIKKLGRLGSKTLITYLVTTFIAVTVGLALVNIYEPGKRVSEDQLKRNRMAYEVWAQDNNVEILDDKCLTCDLQDKSLIEELRAENQEKDTNPDVQKRITAAQKQKDSGPLTFLTDMVPENIFAALPNNGLMLQVIFFAIFFGICLVILPADKSAPLVTIINSINDVFLKMVDLVMKGAPFFVFALLAGVVSEMAGNDVSRVLDLFAALGHYSVTLLAGLAFLVFVFYPSIINLVTKIKYRDFFRKFGPAQLLAFTTSSSAATLPVTMECVTENLKVSPKTANFVLPVGATVNMDGTSLYQAVAVVFLAQFHMVDLTIGQQLTIVLTATLASIGSAAVPSAGLVMMILVLQSVGLNPAWIAIIMTVDRPLDMCRTVVNVTGDATVATLIANSEGELGKQD